MEFDLEEAHEKIRSLEEDVKREHEERNRDLGDHLGYKMKTKKVLAHVWYFQVLGGQKRSHGLSFRILGLVWVLRLGSV